MNQQHQLEHLLNSANIRPQKSFGQNFLVDENIIALMTKTLHLQMADLIFDVGAGLGALTIPIAKKGPKKILAVENDRNILPALRDQTKHLDNVSILAEDILAINFSELSLGSPYKVIGNIPYYLTAKFLRALFAVDHKPAITILLVPNDVAERVCAKPGDMSLLSLSVQIYAQPKIVAQVRPSSFLPAPKITSAVISLTTRDKPLITMTEKQFFRVAKAGFSQKRKQLRNSLAAGLNLESSEISKALKAANIPLKARPQDLSINEWESLAKTLIP